MGSKEELERRKAAGILANQIVLFSLGLNIMILPKNNISSNSITRDGIKTGTNPVFLSASCELILVVALLATCCFVLYYDFLLCNKLYLFKDVGSDSLNIFYPKYVHISNYLRTNGIPGWSFNIGVGQDAFPFSLSNPFELFIVLFPPHLIGYAIIFAECAKIILSGLLIYKAFQLSLFSRPVALAGCIFYAFSGYMVVGGQWHVFSVEAFHVALLIYAFEKYLLDRTRGWLCAAFFLIAACSPFNLYLLSSFFFLYIFMRLWNRHESSGMIYKTISDVALALVAGIGLAAVFFLPALFQMMQNPRSDALTQKILAAAGEGPLKLESAAYYLTLYLRMFSSHLEGINTGWGNYLEAPLMYMGLPVILLAPIAFFSGADRRFQIGIGAVLLIAMAIMLFPFFRFVFWLGTNAYVRFASLIFSTFLLIAALHALESIDKFGRKQLIMLAFTFSICTILLIFFPDIWTKSYIDTNVRNLIIVFLVIHMILLIFLATHRQKKIFMGLFLITVCIEVVTISSFSINGRPVVTREEHEGRSGYNDYSKDAISRINESDRNFFRIVKDYSSSPAQYISLNDGMVQGYHGVSAYQSFNQHNFIRFIKSTGFIETIDDTNSRWIYSLNEQPIMLSLFNCKYILSRNSELKSLYFGYEPFASTGDIFVFKNRFFLPFGYSYGRSMSRAAFEQLTPEEKQIALMQACLIEDNGNQKNILQPFSPNKGKQYTLSEFDRDISELSKYALKITTFQPERIEGEIRLDQPRLVLFSMPFDKGWTVSVDGRPEQLVMANGGLTGITVRPGVHRLILTYQSPWRTTGAVISLTTALALVLPRRRQIAEVLTPH